MPNNFLFYWSVMMAQELVKNVFHNPFVTFSVISHRCILGYVGSRTK